MADASATSPQDQAGSAHRMATQPSVVGLPWGQNGLSTRGHLSALRTSPALPTRGPCPRAQWEHGWVASDRGWEEAETTPCRVLTQSGALRRSGVPAPMRGPCGGASKGA